jgi:hypothetical protein
MFQPLRKTAAFRSAIFANKKTKKAKQENGPYGIEAMKEISMQHLILLAVISAMVLYVVILAACLCYVGRHRRRTSWSPALLNHRDASRT